MKADIYQVKCDIGNVTHHPHVVPGLVEAGHHDHVQDGQGVRFRACKILLIINY